MEFSVLLEKMFIFIALMLIAYVMARKGLLGPAFTRAASKLVIDVFMVGTILSSLISTGAERGFANLGNILLLTFIVTVIGYVVAAVMVRVVPIEGHHKASYEMLIAVGNSMFISLPIAESIYGPYSVLIISVSCVAFNVLLYSYGIWRLKGGRLDAIRIRDMISIPLIATVIGILIMLTHLPIPKILLNLFSALNGATMPMSMMVIGASLGSVSLFEAFRNPKLAFVSLIRLVLIPLLTWLVCRFLTDDTVLLMTCMILAAAPSAVMVTILSIQYGHDGVFASEGVFHTTVCSMITIPLLIMILSRFS